MLKLAAVLLVGSTPLVWFHPRSIWLTTAVIVLAFLWWSFKKIKKSVLVKTSILVIMFLTVAVGGMVSSEMYNFGSGIDRERFFWEGADFKSQIITRENEALYLPYKLRVVTYNVPVIVNYWLGSIFGLVKINNLIGLVGLINTAPLIIGLIDSFRKRIDWLAGGWLTVSAMIGAMNRMPDKSNTFYMALPVITYFTFNGWKRIFNVK